MSADGMVGGEGILRVYEWERKLDEVIGKIEDGYYIAAQQAVALFLLTIRNKIKQWTIYSITRVSNEFPM